MANYATLKAAVADVVKTNGTQAITGANLQAVLLSIINSIGANYTFAGVATPSTNAGTPDQNVFYIGGAGTYANFGTSVTVPVGSICVFRYDGNWVSTQVKLFDGIDDVPLADSNNLVKSNGIFNDIADSVSPITGIKPVVGFLSSTANYNTNGTGYVIPVMPGDSVYIRNGGNNTYSCFYAFLSTPDRPYVTIDRTRYSISPNDSETITVPSGCTALWIADSYQALIGVYTPASVMVNNNELLISQLGNRHTIYGNDFIDDADATSLSVVLQAIPLNFRSELALLQWRDNRNKLHLNMFVSEKPNINATWTNVDYWKEVLFEGRVDDSENIYPLYFNRDKSNYVTFRDNLVIGSDGDSFECEVTCGVDTSLNGGHGFSRNPIQANNIAISVSFELFYVRADDGEYIFRYEPNMWHYTFKIQCEGNDIKLYVNDVLVSIFDNSSGKKVTIDRLGYVNSTYGYWNGTIHWLKVNGSAYTTNFATINTDKKPDTPKMYAAKTDTNLTIYRQYDDLTYISFPMIHATKSYTAGEYPSYYNNWGLRQPSLCYWNGTSMTTLNTLFRNGEAELAVQVKDDSNNMTYVGGSTHGFENVKVSDSLREISFVINNKAVGETDEFSLKPVSNIVVRQFTQLVPAYTNTNPFADVKKVWEFGDKLLIHSSIKFTRSINSDRLMQGMFCVFRHISGNADMSYLTNRAVKDNVPYIVYDTSDGWNNLPSNDGLNTPDAECSEIYEYGDTPLGFSMKVTDDNRDVSGGMFVATNGTSYNKIYYASKVGETEVAANTEYHATQIWSFL